MFNILRRAITTLFRKKIWDNTKYENAKPNATGGGVTQTDQLQLFVPGDVFHGH